MQQPPPSPSQTILLGGGTLDLDRAVLESADGPVNLTATEVDLLRYFLARPGMVVERSDLLREVWGYRAGVVSRAVDHTVKRLRAKIEADRRNPAHLITVTGRGYRFELPDEAEPSQRSGPDTAIPQLQDAGVDRAIVESWLDSHASHPGLVLLAGPAGIGKSRTLAAWASKERARGRTVLWLACRHRSDTAALEADTMLAFQGIRPTGEEQEPVLVIWDDTDDLPGMALQASAGSVRAVHPAVTIVRSQVAAHAGIAEELLVVPHPTLEEARHLIALRSGNTPSPSDADLTTLLDAVDRRPGALETLAPLLGLFSARTLLERLEEGAEPLRTPTSQPTSLVTRSPQAAAARHWAACSSSQQDLVVACLALGGDFSPSMVERVVDAGPESRLSDLLALTKRQLLLTDSENRLRIDPFLRRWLSAQATPAQRIRIEQTRRRQVTALLEATEGRTPAAQRELQTRREAAVGWAVEHEEPDMATRLLMLCGATWRRTGDGAALADVMARLDAHPPVSEDHQARLLAFRARWLLGLGDRPAARETGARAVALARSQDDPGLRSDVCRDVGLLSVRLELPADLQELPSEAVDCVRHVPNSVRLARALSARGGLRIDRGDYQGAEADLSEAIHRFEGLGHPTAAARCRGRIATLRKLAGRFPESLALFAQARAEMTPDAPAYDQANLRMNHANLLADLGRLETATDTYGEAIEICMDAGEHALAASIRGSLATVLSEQQRYDEARLVFAEALRVHRLNGSRTQLAWCTLGLIELSMDTGDTVTAGDLLDDMDSYTETLASPQITVALGLMRAVWLSRTGRPDDASVLAGQCKAKMDAHRIRRQQTGLLFALGLAAASSGRMREARAHATALRAELTRLQIGESSILWRRLAELDGHCAASPDEPEG